MQIKAMIRIKTLARLLIAFSMGCSPSVESGKQHQDTTPTIRLAVAANMQFAIEKLTETFTKQSGITCETIISSSGKLTAQIRQGAPFDLLLSADMKYPRELFQSGLATAPPKVYAYGRLVLWTMNPQITPTLKELTNNEIKHVAIPNPQIAPYGLAAQHVLQKHQLMVPLKEKLVFGESISQTNQFVMTQAAEVGFTALSVVLSTNLSKKGEWTIISSSDYPPIAQGVVMIKRENSNHKAILQFFDFLSSPTAIEILKKYGYGVE